MHSRSTNSVVRPRKNACVRQRAGFVNFGPTAHVVMYTGAKGARLDLVRTERLDACPPRPGSSTPHTVK